MNKTQQYQEVIESCAYILHNDPIAETARNYLNSRISKQAQKHWEFGYFPPDEHLDYLSSLIEPETLKKLGLIYPKCISGQNVNHGHFHEHNIIMPFRDAHGNIISISGRTLLDEETWKAKGIQKYKYTYGTSKDFCLFGIDKALKNIIKKNSVIGVEGQFDCISLHENGIDNAVAFGCANISKYHMFQLLRYTNNIVIMLDNDEAGQRGKLKTKTKYAFHANIKTISPPKGFKDIDEFFRNYKNQEYRKVVIDKLNSC